MDKKTPKRWDVTSPDEVPKGSPDAGLSPEWPLDPPTETSVIHDERSSVQTDSGATAGHKSSPDRDL